MSQKQIAPYGSWKSPITAKELFVQYTGLRSIRPDGDDLYWSESRPDGRSVIVRRSADGRIEDVTPPGYDARTRVHEYGGGEYLPVGGKVYFSNFSDQRLYVQSPGEQPQLLTPGEGMRYADAILDSHRQRLILVREDHTTGSPQPVNTIAEVPLRDGDNGRVLISGNDFYSNPRINPDGNRLTWLTWNHPNMPWDGTNLWVGEMLPDGTVGQRTLVAGGITESIFQPEWSPDGSLYFISDRTGWWNLYRWREGRVESLCTMQAEFGEPQWVFGMSSYAFDSADRLVCSYSRNGVFRLAILDTHSLALEPLDLPYTVLIDVRAASGRVSFMGASPALPAELVEVDLATKQVKVVRRVREIMVDPTYFSVAQPVEFPTSDGLTAFSFFYPPQNPEFTAPAGERPPLLVMSHGGPTGFSSAVLAYRIQYWTTRGIAVLDVNYGGSTGYGRAYRERLKGKWGIVDMADCVNGARWLADQGLVDGNRLAITGGSAGGYTTLCALTFSDVFKAGASYYGISDLEALAKDTHKFESRYLDGLIGPYPERRDLYVSRSPIHHTDRLACPMIILQGLDDPVVPPNQAQMMYETVRTRGLPVAYLTFPGEQHGFLKAENNIRALEAELYFYSRIFGFDLADEVEPVHIENL